MPKVFNSLEIHYNVQASFLAFVNYDCPVAIMYEYCTADLGDMYWTTDRISDCQNSSSCTTCSSACQNRIQGLANYYHSRGN